MDLTESNSTAETDKPLPQPPAAEILAADSQPTDDDEKSTTAAENEEEKVVGKDEKTEKTDEKVDDVDEKAAAAPGEGAVTKVTEETAAAESGADSMSPPPAPAEGQRSTRKKRGVREVVPATTTDEAEEGGVDEPRQLRKRVPKPSPISFAVSTSTASSNHHTSSRRSPAVKSPPPMATRHSSASNSMSTTSSNRKAASSASKVGSGAKKVGTNSPAAQHTTRLRAAAGPGGSRGGGTAKTKRKARSAAAAASNDLYDSDDFDDTAKPLPPLKHVHVARAAFGDVKFTKAAGDNKPKYINTSKSAEIRRRQSSPSNAVRQQRSPNKQILSAQTDKKRGGTAAGTSVTPVVTRKRPSRSSASDDESKKRQLIENAAGSPPAPKSRKRVSIKSSLSSGEMGDISSYDSKATNSTLPKSTPSSGNKNSSPMISSAEMLTAPSLKQTANKDGKSPQHVSFVEDREMDEDFLMKDEKKSTNTPSTGGKRSSSGAKSSNQGSFSLFSDVEQKVCDDFDAEDFFADRTKGSPVIATPKPTPKSRRKRVASPQHGGGTDSYDDENEGENDLKILGALDEDRQGQSLRQQRGGAKGSAAKRQKMTPGSTTESSDYQAAASSRGRKKQTSATPKQKQPHLERLTPEEQASIDKQAQGGVHLNPGCRVLAKWIDKNFYPGNILLNYGLGRYKVRFLDGGYRDMPHPDVVSISRLKLDDVLMFATVTEDGDDELQPISILNTPSLDDAMEWDACVFEVQNHVKQKVEKISWEKLVIDVDQTKLYVSTLINKAAQDVVSDNISESKVRRTRGLRSVSPTTSDVGSGGGDSDKNEFLSVSPRGRGGGGGTTGGPRTPRGKPRKPSQAASAAAATTDSSATADDVTTLESTTTAATTEEKRGRGKRRGPASGLSDSATYSSTDPLVNGKHELTDDDQIFNGLKFVLTSANRGKPTTKDGSSDSAEEEKPLIPFNKKEVRQMIDEYGGVVLEEFAVIADASQNCFLIADQHYRTHKYLSALARAVPCVSHMWIYDSVRENKLLPYKNYVLPAGQSLETNKIVEWHDECPTLLSGLSVFVYTENRPTNPGALDFVQIWAPMVRCMGAKLLDKLPDAEDENARVDILLTDVSCPNSVLTKAAKIGASAVSSEWLIQAIIAGSRPASNGHPKYRYDYVEQNAG